MRFYSLISTVLLFCLSAGAVEKKSIGRVSFLKGEVLIQGQAAKDGQLLFEGDVVETLNGKVTVLLGKDSVFHLDSNSKFVITEKSIPSRGSGEESEEDKALLHLEKGKTRALIRARKKKRKKFRIRVRGMIMGVRGTVVYIDNPADLSMSPQLATLSGEADLYLPSNEIEQKAVLLSDSGESVKSVKMTPNLMVSPGGGEFGNRSEVKTEVIPVETLVELANEVAEPAPEPQTLSQLQEFASSTDGAPAKPESVIPTLEEIQMAESGDGTAEDEQNPFAEENEFIPNEDFDALENKGTVNVSTTVTRQ